MNYDLSTKLHDVRGKVIVLQSEGGAPLELTLGDVCLAAIQTPNQEDVRLTVPAALARYRLAQKIGAGGIVEMTLEEAASLKGLIVRTCATWTGGIIIIGAALDILDQTMADPGQVRST